MRALVWSVACALACASLAQSSGVSAQDAAPVGQLPDVDAGPAPTQAVPPPAPPAPTPAAQPSAAPPAPPPSGYWYNLPYASRAPMPYAPYGQAPDEATRKVRRWYGWQTLLADGLTATVFVVAAAQDRSDDQEPFLILGSLGWFLAPPIIHFGHGNVAKGFGSLGLRAAPVLFILMAVAQCFDSPSDDGSCTALTALGLLSIPAAVIVDAAALAYDEREERPTAAFSLAFGPWHDARRDAWGLGLKAAF